MNKLNVEECSKLLWEMHISVSGFYNEYAKSVGLTLPSLKVLSILHREVSCTQKYITQLTYLPKQTVNTIIKGFNKQGIVTEPIESNSDKRNKDISLTEEGKKYAEKIISKAQEAEYRALEKLGEEKRTLMVEAIVFYTKSLSLEE